MTRKMLTVAALVMLASPAAHADDWYVLNHGDRTCVSAAAQPQGVRTPYEWEMFLRSRGEFYRMGVERDGPTVIAAHVYRDGEHHMDYFRTLAGCRAQLRAEFNGVTKDDLN